MTARQNKVVSSRSLLEQTRRQPLKIVKYINFLCDVSAVKYALLEFPSSEPEEKPEVSVVPWSWVEEDEKICWWPSTKSSIALMKAITTAAPVKPGWTQPPFTKILGKYG